MVPGCTGRILVCVCVCVWIIRMKAQGHRNQQIAAHPEVSFLWDMCELTSAPPNSKT